MGAVAEVRLCRGERGNAIDLATAEGLRTAAGACADDRVRAVLLAADGRSFCVGGDLGEFAALPPDRLGPHLRAVTAALHDALRMLAGGRAPVVVAVQGAVAGAGMGLVCSADISVVAEDASFVPAYPAIGFTPDAGLSWLLPRLVGRARALELLLLNRRLTATEALALGLVTRVVPADRVERTARELAGRLAAGPVDALAAARRLVAGGLEGSWSAQLDAESAAIAAAATSAEGLEGLAAFTQKRAPDYART
jgi:2-(1,2-epoxy-1,2-dihydrophenyl)acetyl-CoA isomerase